LQYIPYGSKGKLLHLQLSIPTAFSPSFPSSISELAARAYEASLLDASFGRGGRELGEKRGLVEIEF
jgi:hypothetical protein